MCLLLVAAALPAQTATPDPAICGDPDTVPGGATGWSTWNSEIGHEDGPFALPVVGGWSDPDSCAVKHLHGFFDGHSDPAPGPPDTASACGHGCIVYEFSPLPTDTPTPTPGTTGEATSTPTETALPPTATQTTAPPTSTPTATASPSATATASFTPTATPSATPSATSTATPSATPTSTLAATATATLTPTNTSTPTPTPSATPDGTPPPLDIDGDGNVDALTDGLLLLRRMFGFQGSTLTNDAVDPDCKRCTPEEIESYIDSLLD